MSLAEIESELANLSPDELRRLALKSWSAFVQKESSGACSNECSEEDPALLEALDRAVAAANSRATNGLSGDEVRARLSEWTSK